MVVENLESLMILKVLLPLRYSPLESELEEKTGVSLSCSEVPGLAWPLMFPRGGSLPDASTGVGRTPPVISPLRLLGEGSKLGGERPRSLRDRLGDRSATLNFLL